MRLIPNRLAPILCVLTIASSNAFAQDIKATYLKHLKTSREFTLKVAGQMPEASYDFKLTPPQMSFAEQMVHLSGSLDFFLSSFSGEKPKNAKPASMKKADVIAFMTKSFDDAIDRVSKLSPDSFSKTYKGEEGQMTGLEILMMMMDHTTHHRASAEMYLRAKGITPTEYEF
jgi:uncharacterized damage-inducible protein DinB